MYLHVSAHQTWQTSRWARHCVPGALVRAIAGGTCPHPAPLPLESPAASSPAQVDVPTPTRNPCFVPLLQPSAFFVGPLGGGQGARWQMCSKPFLTTDHHCHLRPCVNLPFLTIPVLGWFVLAERPRASALALTGEEGLAVAEGRRNPAAQRGPARGPSGLDHPPPHHAPVHSPDPFIPRLLLWNVTRFIQDSSNA